MRCVRCGEETRAFTMSMFNTDEICLKCKDDERQRPDYKAAVEADERAILAGDFNFPGIGWSAEPCGHCHHENCIRDEDRCCWCGDPMLSRENDGDWLSELIMGDR